MNTECCARIPGSSKMHSIFAPDQCDLTKLLLRELLCFCGPCLDENFAQCESGAYVKAWTVFKIQPRNIGYAAALLAEEDDEDSWEYEYDGECMGDLVQPGDNFAVPAEEGNDEGVAFYILQCQQAKHVVEEDFECVWGGNSRQETLSFLESTTRNGDAHQPTIMCFCRIQG